MTRISNQYLLISSQGLQLMSYHIIPFVTMYWVGSVLWHTASHLASRYPRRVELAPFKVSFRYSQLEGPLYEAHGPERKVSWELIAGELSQKHLVASLSTSAILFIVDKNTAENLARLSSKDCKQTAANTKWITWWLVQRWVLAYHTNVIFETVKVRCPVAYSAHGYCTVLSEHTSLSFLPGRKGRLDALRWGNSG